MLHEGGREREREGAYGLLLFTFPSRKRAHLPPLLSSSSSFHCAIPSPPRIVEIRTRVLFTGARVLASVRALSLFRAARPSRHALFLSRFAQARGGSLYYAFSILYLTAEERRRGAFMLNLACGIAKGRGKSFFAVHLNINCETS